MDIIIFILMNLAVITSSYLLTYKVAKISNRIDSLICLFILYLSQIVISEIILGIFNALYLKNIILLNLSFLILVYFIFRSIPSTFSNPNILFNLKKLAQNRIILLSVCVITVFGLVKIFINLANPPFGWDSLNYHFTFAVEWLKSGNLNVPIVISDDPSPTYYPINGSLFYLWLMLPLRNVFLADLGQVPFFILAGLAVYNIARKIGIGKEFSFYATALFLLIPNFFKQLQIAYVDLMMAGLFLTCVNYLFLLQESFSWKNVLIFSLSLGLFLGTKTTALPFAALLLIPFCFLCLKNLRKIYLGGILILGILALGGFSYIRNFYDTGNPLYPLNLNLFGKVIFKGVIDTSSYRIRFDNADYGLGKILFHEGLGAQTLLFALPSLFLALPAAWIKKRRALNFHSLFFLALPIFILLIYRFCIPLANVRYIYSFFGIGMISAFYLAGVMKIPKAIIKTMVLICVLVSSFELAKRQELISSVILTVLLFFPAKYLINRIAIFKAPRTVLFILFSILTLLGLKLTEAWYLKNEFPRYLKMVKYSGFWPEAAAAWDWLNQNTSGNNVAYVGKPIPLPLYGTNFKNNVYYVSVNSVEPVKIHYFLNSKYDWGKNNENMHSFFEGKNNYRGNADYGIWFNNLLKRQTQLFFVYSLHHYKTLKFPVEDEWAANHPKEMRLVFKNTSVHIYKIIK